MDGFEVCKRLKADELTRDVPVIFLSAADDVRIKVKAFSTGGLDYITKPFQVAEVIARVETHLKLRQVQNELENEIENRKRYEAMLEFEQQKLKAQNSQLENVFKKMENDLNIAGEIQRSLLPLKKIFQGVRAEWLFEPCTSIGGDIFNIFQLDDNNVGFYLLDVSGHGIHSALLSVTLSKFLSTDGLAYNLLTQASGKITSPSEVMNLLNLKFQLDIDLNQYFTIIYGIINTTDRKLTYSSAGHTPMVHWASNEKPENWEFCAPPIGLVDLYEYTEVSKNLSPGTKLVLYSDGILELTRIPGEDELGLDGLIDILVDSEGETIGETRTGIEQIVKNKLGENEQKDDISLLILEIK
ncbi:SpoIIE family protein phosphatase, partial [bacterium]|nr:SpoIIE family protein phosphatase [bacterium]